MVYQGHCLDVLRTLPRNHYHMVVTSPPYWSLRDYRVPPTVWGGELRCDHEWGEETFSEGFSGKRKWQHGENNVPAGSSQAGRAITRASEPGVWRHVSRGVVCAKCGAWLGCLGLEPTPQLYVEHVVMVFKEVYRVLRDDGTCWLNLGDCYAAGGRGGDTGGKSGLQGSKRGQEQSKLAGQRLGSRSSFRRDRAPRGVAHKIAPGIKPKDLVGLPWMVAFALRDAGWYLRSDNIWAKTNPMPESTTDRTTRSHEYVFMLAKREKYFYDADAIRERVTGTAHGRGTGVSPKSTDGRDTKSNKSFHAAVRQPVGSRNKRSVWFISTQPYKEAHFACVDSETEALTPYGWRREDQLRDGDEIAAYDQAQGRLLWQPATFHRYESAPLVSLQKRDLSMVLTPNHRCLVRARTKRGHQTRVVEASALNSRHEILTSSPFSDQSTGIGIEWASLLGWFIAEGHILKSPDRVDIYQSHTANPLHVATIRALLESLDADFRECQRAPAWRGRPADYTVFEIRGAVAQKLLYHARSKRLHPGLVWLPIEEASALLQALVAGDGHTRADGRFCFVQKSKECADFAQMIGIRLGLRAVVSPRSQGDYVVYFTKGGWLTLRGSNGSTERPKPVAAGPVWCPSVASTFWLARRGGRPFITGNTFPIKLVKPCILASTSAYGCCPRCGAQFARMVMRGRPLEEQKALGGCNKDGRYHGQATKAYAGAGAQDPSAVKKRILEGMRERITVGWRPTCRCGGLRIRRNAFNRRNVRPWYRARWQARIDGRWSSLFGPISKPLVLDPFGGSGTTRLVAERLGRNADLIELNAEYIAMADRRVATEEKTA
jgi:DNA modification methylase